MNPRAEDVEEAGTSLVDHLAELRTRLIYSLLAILVGAFVCFYVAGPILDALRKPIEPFLPAGGLIYTGPIDKFMAYMKIAVVGGVIVTCPFWLWQIWKFVAPGLYQKERKFAVGFIASGTTLFLGGVAFSYYVVLPTAFGFLMTFGSETDKPMIAIDSYLSFVTHITLMFGLAFELPLALVTLSMLGIVSRQFLAKNRRYAVMAMATVAAIITPPDLLSMVLMLGPMWLLYEFSLVLVGMVERKRAHQES